MSGIVQKYPVHNSLLPLFFAWQLAPSNGNYNLSFSYTVKTEMETELVAKKLQELIHAKSYLRQTFSFEGNKLFAYIHEELPAEINILNCCKSEFSELEKRLIQQPHDIENVSAIKLNIIRINDYHHYVILFNIHHVLMDAQSVDRFIIDLNSSIAKQKIKFITPNEYIDEIMQEPFLTEEIEDIFTTTYLEKINFFREEINYPAARPQKSIEYYTDILPGELREKLIQLKHQCDISLFNLLLLAWGIFSHKLFDSIDVLISYPINIRRSKILEGCFINNFILPMSFSENDTYLSVINTWREQAPTLKKIAKIKLSDKLNVGSTPGFVHSNMVRPLELVIQDKRYAAKSYPQIANYNLSVKYKERNGNYFFSCDIISELFPEHFSSTLLPRFFNLLNELLTNVSAPLSTLDITLPEEKQRLLYEFNSARGYYPKNTTLTELFEAQVKRTPHDIAIVYEETKLTYTQLNERANQLAYYLKNNHTIKSDDLIVLLLERNEYMLISILGALKSGAAYVPLDLTCPPERISSILEDTKVKIILTNEICKNRLCFSELQLPQDRCIIEVDAHSLQTILVKQKNTDLISAANSTDLAYVIYTSGTTGKPKGVMVEHRGIINTIFSINKVYSSKNIKIKSTLKITAFTSYVFDVSISEFFVALLNGHELHILSNSMRHDINLIAEYINKNKINYIYLPPVMLANLPKIDYPSLQGIIYAGEPCDKKTASHWSNKHELYNYYGPTEASIYSTGLKLKSAEVNLIGKPIMNTTAYVLNSEKLLQPIGVIGELFIGGVGLARGYLNALKLTCERFIANPFQTPEEKKMGENARLYKTGDLVRWRSDGNLEYIGRNDFQVKIRGYRIELSEIENKLAAYPGIKLAIVLIKKDEKNHGEYIKNKYLVAYYLAEQKIESVILDEYLAMQLPEYMLPNIFIHLKQLPLTINGKLDRKALPEAKFVSNEKYIAPNNAAEELLCMAFSQILGLEKIGINDDFFRLGGNSIKAIALAAKLQANFNISVTDVFNLKTPSRISQNISLMRNNLKKNLIGFKSNYEQGDEITQEMQDKLDNYWNSSNKIVLDHKRKKFVNILLTGGTGFLGCNLLNQLLTLTDYNIFLLVRANSDTDAFDRANQKFQFYFGKNLYDMDCQRIFVLSADIEKENLDVSLTTYQLLMNSIDSIIHCAAFTKHYGEFDKFYSVNVRATVNLLKLSCLTKSKDFHYISTTSVLNQGYIANCNYFCFTEDDTGANLEKRFTAYAETKYQGEQAVVEYRKQGVKANIYRIGNLAFISSNGISPENIKDNAFFNRINCLLKLGITTQAISLEEISPADLTAQAIVKLFDKAQLSNQDFHIFNPNLYNIAEFFNQHKSYDVKMLTFENFSDIIVMQLANPKYQKIIQKFLLHQGWLNGSCMNTTVIRILQDKTEHILQQLGFKWEIITDKIFNKYIEMEIKSDKKFETT